MDVPNFVGSKYRPRSKFKPEEAQNPAEVPASEILRRIMEVIKHFNDARHAVELELERIVDEENQAALRLRPEPRRPPELRDF